MSSVGDSDRGSENPGEFTKSATKSEWVKLLDAEGTRTLGPGRTRMDPHAMRTWAGTRLNQESKTPGMGVIVSSGMLSFEKPS